MTRRAITKRTLGMRTAPPRGPLRRFRTEKTYSGTKEYSHLTLEVLHDIQEVIVDIRLVLELQLDGI